MEKSRLGRTELQVTRLSFGALPIQRCSPADATTLLQAAQRAGVNFFDTARAYSDSEEKIGHALSDCRGEIILATKTGARDAAGVRRDLEISRACLQTDTIDILQLHNPPEVPDPDDPDSSYHALREAQQAGTVRHIGMTNHRLAVAREAVRSGLFATLQYPLSALSSAEDFALVDLCREHDVGFIAMKALCGGILTDIPAAFAALHACETVVPIWGIQRLSELEELLALDAAPPALDAPMRERLDAERATLGDRFCRGCGYCLPCPAEIPIPMAARMRYLLRRAPTEDFLTPDWQERMGRIRNCTHCGTCHERCPYGLHPDQLLAEMFEDYQRVCAQNGQA